MGINKVYSVKNNYLIKKRHKLHQFKKEKKNVFVDCQTTTTGNVVSVV